MMPFLPLESLISKKEKAKIVNAIMKATRSRINENFPRPMFLSTQMEKVDIWMQGDHGVEAGIALVISQFIDDESSEEYDNPNEMAHRLFPNIIRDGFDYSDGESYLIQQINAICRLSIAAWRIARGIPDGYQFPQDQVSAFIKSMTDNGLNTFDIALVVDDETGEAVPFWDWFERSDEKPHFDETPTSGFENSPLKEFYKYRTRKNEIAKIMITCNEEIIRKMHGSQKNTFEIVNPLVEVISGHDPKLPLGENRFAAIELLKDTEKSAEYYLQCKENGKEGAGHGKKGGRPKKDKNPLPVSENPLPVSENPLPVSENPIIKNKEENINIESNRIESKKGDDEIDCLITRWAMKLGDTKPSRKCWRQFIERHGKDAFEKVASRVCNQDGLFNKGATLNKYLNAYTPPPPPPQQKSWTAKDWELCYERCANCNGTGCSCGIKTPPDKNPSHLHAPEECKSFKSK